MGSQFIYEWIEIGMLWMIFVKNKFKFYLNIFD